MASKELRNRVDAQWREEASAWGQESHDRERKLIYDYLDENENIMGLVGCTWGPISAFREDAGLLMRQQRLKGVAVATDLSVHLLAQKGLSKMVTQMPLSSIRSVEHAGGVVTLDGDGIHNWAGMAKGDPSKSGMFVANRTVASPNWWRGSRPRHLQRPHHPQMGNTSG